MPANIGWSSVPVNFPTPLNKYGVGIHVYYDEDADYDWTDAGGGYWLKKDGIFHYIYGESGGTLTGQQKAGTEIYIEIVNPWLLTMVCYLEVTPGPRRWPAADRSSWTSSELTQAKTNITSNTSKLTKYTEAFTLDDAPIEGAMASTWIEPAAKYWNRVYTTEELEGRDLLACLAGIRYDGDEAKYFPLGNLGLSGELEDSITKSMDVTGFMSSILDQRNNFSGFDFFCRPAGCADPSPGVASNPRDAMLALARQTAQGWPAVTMIQDEGTGFWFPVGTVTSWLLEYDGYSLGNIITKFNLDGWTLPETFRPVYRRAGRRE